MSINCWTNGRFSNLRARNVPQWRSWHLARWSPCSTHTQTGRGNNTWSPWSQNSKVTFNCIYYMRIKLFFVICWNNAIWIWHEDIQFSYFRQYHYEQPWPSAQAEIRRLAAYKTPQDKVACVVRCSQTIMNLLSLASSKSVPAADDFVPVMVFVIIKANPPSLLSTIQVSLNLLTYLPFQWI